MSRFSDAAQKRFQVLLAAGKREPALYYWRVGHAFDTMLDYLELVDRSPTAEVETMAKAHFLAGGGGWYDDFAWWGISSLRASRSALFTDASSFAAMSDYCWHAMDGYAPWVWDRADQALYAEREPRYLGGVWNSTWNGPCTTIDCIPAVTDGLCGTQNTVTNTLYLLHAARLAKANPVKNQGDTNPYFNSAAREYGFLTQWFDLKDDTYSLLGKIQGGGGRYVRERVGTYGKSTDYQQSWAYRPTLAWAGDQGLLVSGLAALAAFDTKNAVEYQDRAMLILLGVTRYLIQNGRFLSWYALDNKKAPGDDAADYSTGVGVLMRCLLDVYKTNTRLATYMQDVGYPQYISAYADFVMANPDNSNGVVGPANDVATLLLANAMGLQS
jgi:hypothetical protein